MRKYIKDMNRAEILKRLSNGDKLTTDGGAVVEVVNGFLCATSANGIETLNYELRLNDGIDWYFELPLKTIEVKVGNFYKTRDGQKAYVYAINNKGDFSVAIEGGNGLCYSILPTGYYSEEKESDRDLVSLREEESNNKQEETFSSQTEARYNKEKRVVELLKQGKSQKEVASELGISPSTVSRLAIKHGLLVYKKSRKINYDDEKLKEMLKQGLTYDEIANKLNMAYCTIARYISTHQDLYSLYKYKR